MKHEDLLKNAQYAIDEVGNDFSVGVDQNIESLIYLQEYIDDLILLIEQSEDNNEL
jgi:hypothetical protein